MKLSEKESILNIYYIEELFSKIDDNSDGFIDQTEFTYFLKYNYYPKLKESNITSIINNIFAKDSQELSFRDFYNFIISNQLNIIASIFYKHIFKKIFTIN